MKRIIIMLAVLATLVAASVGAFARSASAKTVGEYPYLCTAYAAGTWGYIGSELYLCEYVGNLSYTGFAWVPQD